MSAIKPVMREVREAVLKGMAHAKDKLPQAAENIENYLKDFVTQWRKQDVFDGSGASRPNSSPGPYVPNTSRKPPGMSDQDYLDLLESSVHNPNGLEAILGKFRVPGTPSYIDVADGKIPPATYFSLGDRWNAIAKAYDLDDDGMFDAFNVPFLDRLIAEGKPISFSHNPLDFPGSALAAELDFLVNHPAGFRFDPTTLQAIRK